MHDIVTGQKTPDEARAYYGREFLDYRRKKPTPYMERLRVPPQYDTVDPDRPILTDDELRAATEQGKPA